MVRGRARMAGDRPRYGRARAVILAPEAREVAERALVAVGLCFAPLLGWLVAAHLDPRGEALRWTLGWVVGEFR